MAVKGVLSKVQVQGNLHNIMDTLAKCPDYQGVLIFQVSLHAKGCFGAITKCPIYTGVPIFKCPD